MLVGLGAGHGFKFAPTFGRVLADLAVDGATTSDIAAFAADRPALAEPGHPVSGWSGDGRVRARRSAGVDAELGGGAGRGPRSSPGGG